MLIRFEKILSDDCKIADRSAIIAACSGGPDSLALLDLLARLKQKHGYEIIAAHVNHGLRKSSGQDEKLVRDYCKQNGIRITVARWKAPSKGNIEDAARKYRRDFFRKMALKHKAAVALGHHMDDQAETVMLHLIRGSGLKGLSGMDLVSTQSGVTFIRPLLHYWRADIEKYCTRRQLKTALDETNLNTNLLRNAVRLKILPMLTSHNTRIKQSLVRLSQAVKSDDSFLEGIARSISKDVSHNRVVWDRAALKKLPSPILRRALLIGCEELKGNRTDISHDHICKMEQVVAKSGRYSLPGSLLFQSKGNSAALTFLGKR